VCMLTGLLQSGRALAFQPESARVVDRLWGIRQPWSTFQNSTTSDEIRVVLRDLVVDCNDPVAGRHPTTALCPVGGQIDVFAHLFRNIGGEVAAPLRCQAATCELTFTAPFVGPVDFGLLVHGGPDAAGIVSGTLEVFGGTTLIHTAALRLADNIVVDVASPNFVRWEMHSVLVPDGPIRSASAGGAALPGNTGNDNLGVAATEAWILDANFKVIGGDTFQQGVGPAAFLEEATSFWYPNAAWVVVRPWMPPAAGTTFEMRIPNLFGTGMDVVTWANGAKLPPGVPPTALPPGRMRVVLNRFDDDWDNDGVSGAVELQLQTCDGFHPFAGRASCPVITDPAPFRVTDARDTDGDALSDGSRSSVST